MAPTTKEKGMKMRKGDLVKLDVAKCFTERNGGERRFPLTNHHNDDLKVVIGARPTTTEERTAWYNTDAARGIGCDGETKLPPQATAVAVEADMILIVERARCRVQLGWGNPRPGMTQVMLPNGETAFLPRGLLQAAA